MIDYTIIDITALNDYDQLKGVVGNSLYVSDGLIEELKERIGLKCKRLVVESLYRDFDFSSIYSSFYSKKHNPLPKECFRIHFFIDSDPDFSKEGYGGFMVLRPSAIGDSRGRSHIAPSLLVDSKNSFIMLAKSKAHILGTEYKVEAFPWMAQETDISRCAHSAAWSIIRYFSDKYNHYKKRSINDIVEMAPLYLNRKTPSEGLNLLQLSEVLAAAGFHPLILKREGKTKETEERFKSSLFAYIESGIPVIAALPDKDHAISIIGHGEINKQKMAKYKSKAPTLSHVFIDSLIGIDDNFLPYKTIARKPKKGEYGIDDIKYALVPLYEKMFLPADIVIMRTKHLIKSKQLSVPENAIIRPYITSSRSLKRETRANDSMNLSLQQIILTTPMPQFVWCVDISSIDEYRADKNSARIIIDVTAATKDNDPWILIHDSSFVLYYDFSQGWVTDDIAIEPYEIYTNNLEEVKL